MVEIARELVTLLSAILTAGAAPAFAEQPRTAADCHAPTRQHANERENAVNALGVVAGKRRVEAQSAERALRKRQHQYLTAKQPKRRSSAASKSA
jgi:hypothetical protein